MSCSLQHDNRNETAQMRKQCGVSIEICSNSPSCRTCPVQVPCGKRINAILKLQGLKPQYNEETGEPLKSEGHARHSV